MINSLGQGLNRLRILICFYLNVNRALVLQGVGIDLLRHGILHDCQSLSRDLSLLTITRKTFMHSFEMMREFTSLLECSVTQSALIGKITCVQVHVFLEVLFQGKPLTTQFA